MDKMRLRLLIGKKTITFTKKMNALHKKHRNILTLFGVIVAAFFMRLTFGDKLDG